MAKGKPKKVVDSTPAPPLNVLYFAAIGACIVAFAANNYLPDERTEGAVVSGLPFVARRLHTDYPKTVQMCRNGEHEDCKPHVIESPLRDYSTAKLVKELTDALPADYLDEGQPRLFSERGFMIANADEIANGERVNVVPSFKQYVRPTVAVGHKVLVEDIDNPVAGLPIEIETLETTPRY
jgi:hypothetical protein